MRLRAFSINRICGTHGSTATVLFTIHHSSAAHGGTNPPAEAVEEVSGAGNATKFIDTASEQFNIIARVCAFAMAKFVETATTAEWRIIAAERTPGNGARPVSLNADPLNAGKTAQRVFDKIFTPDNHQLYHIYLIYIFTQHVRQIQLLYHN